MRIHVLVGILVLVSLAPTASASCHLTPLGCPLVSNGFTFTMANTMTVNGALAVETTGANSNASYRAERGDEGKAVVTFVKYPGASNATANVTVSVPTVVAGLVWKGTTTRSFVFNPLANPPHSETFAFVVAAGAPAGWVSIPVTVAAFGETAKGNLGFEVAESPAEPNWLPLPGGAALVAALVAAGSVLRRR